MACAVAEYIDSRKNFKAVDLVKRKILDLYRDDIMKIKDTAARQRAIAENAELFGLG